MRKTRAIIDLKNLKSNYLNIRKKVSPSRIMAVVKADAYGHGMEQCARFLKSLVLPPEYFGVALLEEALSLRPVAGNIPILVFAPLQEGELDLFVRNKIEATVFSNSHLKMLQALSGRKKLLIHIKVDTGMGRLGVHYSKAVEYIRLVTRYPNVRISGIYTHFASSDEVDKSFAGEQLRRFKEIINQLKREEIECGLVHSANSGAILDMPETYFDMVRPGISLYGYYPSRETSESIKVKPVMAIYSEVDSVKTVLPGESVSYGRRFIAKSECTVGTVPIGYADGLYRVLSGKIHFTVKNRQCKQIGTITMDRTAFLAEGVKLKVGDTVMIMGKGHGKGEAADMRAETAGTIPYEVLCSITKRVPREYQEESTE